MADGGLALGALRGPGGSEMETQEGEDRTPLLKESQPGTGERRSGEALPWSRRARAGSVPEGSRAGPGPAAAVAL